MRSDQATARMTLEQFEGKSMIGSDGSKIGTIADVYFDRDTREPEWALVTTGMFGTKHSFVPITDASSAGDEVRVPFTKDQVKDAPNLDDDGELSQEEELELSRHYGLTYSEAPSDTGLPVGGAPVDGGRGDIDLPDHPVDRTDVDLTDRTTGRDTSGPTTDDAMTRSEERMNVGVARRPSGLARLRKYVTTEQVSDTVPVSHERLTVEREPISEGNVDRAMAGPELSEEEHEVTLMEEHAVVDKEVVPVERVRLDKETVTEEQTVTDSVRKEQIDIDEGPTGDRRT